MSPGTCSVCGKRLKAIRLHERTAHGIYKRGPKAAALPAVVAPEVVNNGKPKPLTFKPMPYVVLESNDGGVWLAERIR